MKCKLLYGSLPHAVFVFESHHAVLFFWSFLVCPWKLKCLLMKCAQDWTAFKYAETNFFWVKIEVCCKRDFTVGIKVIWRVTEKVLLNVLIS